MLRRRWIPGATIAILLVGCGSSDNASDEAAPSTVADAVQAAREAMGNVPGMAPDADAPSLTTEQLRDKFPETLAGMTRTELTVTSGGMAGMNATTAVAEYQVEGAGTVDIAIADMSAVPGMAMANAAWAMTTFDRTTSDGFERTSTFEGYPSLEQQSQDDDRYDSSLSILCGNYVVTLDGPVPLETLTEAAGQLGLREMGG